METILLISTVLALYGAYLNSVGNWYGFMIWTVTNFVFFINNLLIDQWQQALLFMCYMLLSANGIWCSIKKL